MQIRFLTPLPKAHSRVTIVSCSKASKNEALGVGKVTHSPYSLRSAQFCCAPFHCAALHSALLLPRKKVFTHLGKKFIDYTRWKQNIAL